MKWNPLDLFINRTVETEQVQRSESQSLRESPEAQHESSAADQIFISRQPILEDSEKVAGFHLQYRPFGSFPEVTPNTPIESTRLALDLLNTYSASSVLGEHQGWINMPDRTIQSDLIQLLPRNNFVLECPQQILQDTDLASHCERLLQRGYALAVNITHVEIEADKLSHAANRVIYDLAHLDLPTIAKLDQIIKPLGLKRLLRNVNTREAFKAGQPLGFEYYQGTFFKQPQTLFSQRLDPSRARVIELFNLVMKKADVDIIEDAFKHDVALCYSLLCYINSVGIGMQYKVSSIRNAIMLMGYDFLWRWLSLLIYAGIDLSAAQRALLNSAIIRGRLTELLGQIHLNNKEANALFVVGNFSMLDTLLGIPMAQALERIKLPDDIHRALVDQDGKYAPYLQLALAFESADAEAAVTLCKQIGISMTDASRAHFAAIEWARMFGR